MKTLITAYAALLIVVVGSLVFTACLMGIVWLTMADVPTVLIVGGASIGLLVMAAVVLGAVKLFSSLEKPTTDQ